jgi:hypothetical protein
MNDQEYLNECRAQFRDFAQTLATRTAQLPDEHPLKELANAAEALAGSQGDLYDEGPALVVRLFDTYPEFAPTFPRQLLWFFGGDCLHYMADDEIEEFQRLEESRRPHPVLVKP